MKLQTKFTAYLASALILSGIALVANGYWIINKIIFNQYESQLSRELQNLVVEVEQSYATLEKAGILDLQAYVLSAQDKLIDKFQDYHFGDTGYLYILDQNGRVVFHPQAEKGGPADFGFEAELLQRRSGSILFEYQDEQEFGVYQHTGVWGWTIMLAIQQKEMFVYRDTYNVYVLLITLVTVLFFLALSREFSKRTTGRVEHTLELIRKMESGDFSSRFVISGEDEISKIELAINHLLEQIEQEIDQRRESESNLREAKEAAEIANRAKSEFLSTMSHEIRTPMNGVIGMTHLLKESGLNIEQQEFIQIIENSSEAMMHVINDILDLSRLESGQIELEVAEFSLQELCDSVVNLFSADANSKNVKLEQVYSAIPEQAVFSGDPGRIRQILMNLIGNAVKFTDEGGINVTVALRSSESGQEDQHIVRFEVIDDGIGIEQENISSLFDSFVQADASVTRKYGGSGLGLAICKRLVDAMQGNIGVSSVAGEGSCFWFELPLTMQLQQAVQDTAAEKPQSGIVALNLPGLPHLKILVVEDILPNQLVARKLLERLGHSVDLANNGIEALEAVQNISYDLVFMDIRMPEMDGLTATTEIRALGGRFSELPIIAMTANATQDDYDECMRAGMNDFVSKPVNFEKLKQALQKVSVAA